MMLVVVGSGGTKPVAGSSGGTMVTSLLPVLWRLRMLMGGSGSGTMVRVYRHHGGTKPVAGGSGGTATTTAAVSWR